MANNICVLKQTLSNINIMQTIFEIRNNHSHQLEQFFFINEIPKSWLYHGYTILRIKMDHARKATKTPQRKLSGGWLMAA